ncbi:hypothetical protein L2E82_33654 [Cichorium intybus]|uniref:Uncharacterized protein n=1 Tax=Cichorium intybus TaxID=13427 RepID=A0ACB9BKS3_CICIN|nr:hypothetical protein L2E82_33654 [Cichorium intybus]
MSMIRNLVRFGKRQLHTIISREIIKPSSPTPSHLKTYNLTVLDQIISHEFTLLVAFYPHTHNYRTSHEKTLNLKNSLSQTLTKYYPFAGRYAKVAPTYVDCNDNGAQFFEASIDSTLSDFLQNSQHEDLDQFFPHGLVNYTSDGGAHDLKKNDQRIPLSVQVNHFECGGLAVAVSMNINSMGLALDRSNDCVVKSFMFPNSKINDLKLKVKAMTAESGEPITNPTRVEVLSWLLYKCAVTAAIKNNSGSFKPTCLYHIANIRDKMIEPLPEKSIGNFFVSMEIRTKNESEMKPESIINELKKQKTQFKGLRNIETAFDIISKTDLDELHGKLDGAYVCSSMCGYSLYEIDFGWGKPVKATLPGYSRKNSFILMDAPNRDGIEALVFLGKEDMNSFQSDPELLAIR